MNIYGYNFIADFAILFLAVGFMGFLFLISKDFRKFKKVVRKQTKKKKPKHKIEYHI